VNYLRAHLQAVHQAEGWANLRGYFVWSLMDNFEWNWGYDRRFGLVHVDFTSQRRTPKQSAYWYRDVITENAVDM
jgi:beta-glucosidase